MNQIPQEMDDMIDLFKGKFSFSKNFLLNFKYIRKIEIFLRMIEDSLKVTYSLLKNIV